jgi:hypothetical protein
MQGAYLSGLARVADAGAGTAEWRMGFVAFGREVGARREGHSPGLSRMNCMGER